MKPNDAPAPNDDLVAWLFVTPNGVVALNKHVLFTLSEGVDYITITRGMFVPEGALIVQWSTVALYVTEAGIRRITDVCHRYAGPSNA